VVTKSEFEYKDKNYIRFAHDCQQHGLTVEHSAGLSSESRPFVRCGNFFDVKEATQVKLQWIKKQSQYLVFPVKSKPKAVRYDATL